MFFHSWHPRILLLKCLNSKLVILMIYHLVQWYSKTSFLHWHKILLWKDPAQAGTVNACDTVQCSKGFTSGNPVTKIFNATALLITNGRSRVLTRISVTVRRARDYNRNGVLGKMKNIVQKSGFLSACVSRRQRKAQGLNKDDFPLSDYMEKENCNNAQGHKYRLIGLLKIRQ